MLSLVGGCAHVDTQLKRAELPAEVLLSNAKYPEISLLMSWRAPSGQVCVEYAREQSAKS